MSVNHYWCGHSNERGPSQAPGAGGLRLAIGVLGVKIAALSAAILLAISPGMNQVCRMRCLAGPDSSLARATHTNCGQSSHFPTNGGEHRCRQGSHADLFLTSSGPTNPPAPTLAPVFGFASFRLPLVRAQLALPSADESPPCRSSPPVLRV